MPNWCEGELVVTADSKEAQEQLQAFKQFAKEGDNVLSANKFVPYPEEFRLLDLGAEKWDNEIAKSPKDKKFLGNRPKDGFNSGGYEWRLHNWGTKWGFCSPEIVFENKKRIQYRFETAWSPALPIVRAMIQSFPLLRFHYSYSEPMMGFKGEFGGQGEVSVDSQHDYQG